MPVAVGVKPGGRALSGTQPRGRWYPLAARSLRTQWESMWEYTALPRSPQEAMPAHRPVVIHSIFWAVRVSTDRGIFNPSALAVFRLMTADSGSHTLYRSRFLGHARGISR